MGTRHSEVATRWHRSERGRYTGLAPWGASLEIERRRAEAGEPPGWYLFGELATGGVIDGLWLGSRLEDALVAAAEWVQARAERQ